MQFSCVISFLDYAFIHQLIHLMELTSDQIQIIQEAKAKRADRIGIFASILCAIHCAITPVLLLVMPTFGKAWAHPATHWGMAIVVIPIAVYMMIKGYRKHGKKWVVGLGSLGILFIIIGSILPYTEIGTSNSSANLSTSTESVTGGG